MNPNKTTLNIIQGKQFLVINLQGVDYYVTENILHVFGMKHQELYNELYDANIEIIEPTPIQIWSMVLLKFTSEAVQNTFLIRRDERSQAFLQTTTLARQKELVKETRKDPDFVPNRKFKLNPPIKKRPLAPREPTTPKDQMIVSRTPDAPKKEKRSHFVKRKSPNVCRSLTWEEFNQPTPYLEKMSFQFILK